jgi:IMP dehydrogenase
VGVKQGDRDRVKELVSAGADVIVVDIAHGHAEQVLDMTRYIKENFSVEVISGNVATSRGVRDLVRAGADAVKVGIGAGSVCITRIVAGAGYPQFSAVANCAAEARKLRIPIIADGNIRAAGDVAKAIGGGADSVMVGSLLAGTDESPGMLITRNDKKYKVTRGMASLGASMARKLKNGADEKVLEELREYVAEGVEALVPYRGKAEEILSQLVRGLQSGMSYTGANSILQMQNKAKFVQVTQAGIRESLPHDVEIL